MWLYSNKYLFYVRVWIPFIRNHGKGKNRVIANSEITQRLFHNMSICAICVVKQIKKRLNTWVHRQTYPWKIKINGKKGILEFPPVYGNRTLFFFLVSSQATNSCSNGFWTQKIIDKKNIYISGTRPR